MKTIIRLTTVWTVGLLIWNCAASPETNTAPPAATSTNVSTATNAQNIFRKIEQQLSELKCLNLTTAVPPAAEVWRGGEEASALFFLVKSPRYPSIDFPPAGKAPFPDLQVTIARYPSSSAAQQAVEGSLRQRPALTPPKENYRGASLYRYASGGATTICQSNRYVIEVNPYSDRVQPLTMKALDLVLGELDFSR